MSKFRIMTVTYSTNSEAGYGGWYSAGALKPMIRIANRFLLNAGFNVSDKILVEYQDGVVIIRKFLANEHQNLVAGSARFGLHQSSRGALVPQGAS
mgnify:FL=1